MQQREPLDYLLGEWLELLGIEHLSESDTLAFLYRHGTSLASAGQLARLLGYPRATIECALERLESGGLIQFSRGSDGVRLYRIAVPLQPERRNSFQRLTEAADSRTGRLALIRALREGAARKRYRAEEGHYLS